MQPADDAPLGVEAVDLELEQLLERDHLALHPLDLGDLDHTAGAVVEPVELDDEVERGGDVAPDRAQRQLVARHQDHRLDAVESIAGRVRVHGRERALVARVHRLEHVERLGAANLADDDPVGPHAERVADEIADRDLALALDVLRPRLEPEHVPLVELELGRVLDRDDPVAVGHRLGEGVQKRRLAGAGAARDQDVQLRLDAALEERGRVFGDRPDLDQLRHVESVLRELADRQQRPRQGQRRDDRVHARAVGQARVDERRRLVDPPADLADHLRDDPAQVRRVAEGQRRRREPAARARSRCRAGR